jgi:hypothetical protein
LVAIHLPPQASTQCICLFQAHSIPISRAKFVHSVLGGAGSFLKLEILESILYLCSCAGIPGTAFLISLQGYQEHPFWYPNAMHHPSAEKQRLVAMHPSSFLIQWICFFRAHSIPMSRERFVWSVGGGRGDPVLS